MKQIIEVVTTPKFAQSNMNELSSIGLTISVSPKILCSRKLTF